MVSIIVLNWNGKELLAECLGSLSETKYGSFRTVVVDNGSTDGSVEMVSRAFPWAELIANRANLGYPRGNNIGIRYALANHHSDYVLLLNNDTKVIDPRWLQLLVASADSDPTIGIVGSLLITPSGNAQEVGLELLPGVHLPYFRRVMRWPGIGCSLIKRSVVEKIGLLDEAYFPIYFEDVDYRKRAQRAGFRVVTERKSLLVHQGSGTTKKRPSAETLYVYKRNGTRFVARYYPHALPLFVLLSYVGCLGVLFEPSHYSRIADLRATLIGTTRAIAHGLTT